MANIEISSSKTSISQTAVRLLIYFVLGLFVFYSLLPLLVMLSNSFRTIDEIKAGSVLALPSAPTLDAWRIAWSEACIGTTCKGLQPHFWVSVTIVVPAVIISTTIGSINGYALTKWRFKGANVIFGLLLFGCFIPYQVVILPMATTLGYLGLAGSAAGLVLVNTLYGLPFTTLFFRNYYVTVPDEIVRAATIDGAGFFKTFWYIVLPISGPIFVVTVIWQFTGIWNDFLFGASFSPTGDSQPVIVALNNLVNTTTGVKYYNVDFAASILAALPVILIYVLAGKYFVRGLMSGSVKG
ncbi:carbohydrate ABC transporter permease [Rhizobium lusitanum]|uniref:carbohydrate ABC transporter permease n=1 Tax=Rhizobium lusitanum TaxID=293958 RepID=UPI001571EC9D|nr:carbohydrate ABC transporter permease [Rhizobium lusitanum]NTJ11543.1 carbohydrate ABC transporter permease [Rhizobium lusitanum]